jgi:DNA-binding XRE family transcriptional regulator
MHVMARPKRPARQAKDRRRESGKDAELLAFGRRVRQFRKAAGLTQEALGHSAGLHWTYVGQIERGERNLTYRNVLKLARGLGLEPSQLMPDC